MRNINPGIPKNDNTHSKSIFSYNVYRTNHQQRNHVRPSNLKSSPIIDPDPEVLYINEKIFQKTPAKCGRQLKECSTQTSKTILQLAHNENGPHADAQIQTSEIGEPAIVDGANTGSHSRSFTLTNNGSRTKPSLTIRRMSGNCNLQANCTVEQSKYCLTSCPNVVPVPQNVRQVVPKTQDVQIPLCINEGTLGAQKSRSVSPMRIGLQIEIIGEGITSQEKTEDAPPSPTIDAAEMTPDSLQQSPRDYYNNYSLENCPYSVASRLSNFTLDGSCTEQDCVFNTSKKTNGNFGDKTLTETFLEKTRNRVFELSQEPKEEFKSKSSIDDFQHPNYIQGSTEPAEVLHTKHKATKKSSKSLEIPYNTYVRTRRSMARFGGCSFMWPTRATQIKSIMGEIQSTNSLIPPIRRGKSTSPKPTADKRRFESSRKIPYIDQSKSDVSSSTTLINATRHPERIPLKDREDVVITKSGRSNRFSDDVLSLSGSGKHSNSSFNDNTISFAIAKLQELDWRLALRGLGEIVEICRIVDVDLVYGYMSSINQRVIDLLKSPRSHVCRTACQAAGHLFEYVKDTARPVKCFEPMGGSFLPVVTEGGSPNRPRAEFLFEEIVDLLLCKTADANKFIRHDANMALDCMVTHIPTYDAIRALCNKGPFHKNPLVRCATARLLVCAIVIGGVDFILNPINNECTRKRIILTMARLLEDYKSLETRKLAERIYKILSKDTRFDVYLKKYLEKEQILKIKHTLRIIRKK